MPDALPVPAAAADAPFGAGPEYAAVVYFHGMGQQRHYEEMCRLVQRLDQYCYGRYAAGDTAFRDRRLVDISGRTEPSRETDGDDVVYVRTRLTQPAPASSVNVRFYEAYWAPETAEAPGALSVAQWIVRQGATPLKTLLAPWRSYERLRRADLIALARKRRDADPAGGEGLIERVTALVRLYGEFQRPDARRRYPRGSFAEFCAFVAGEVRDPDLLHAWRSYNLWRELTLVLSILSLLVGAAAGIGLLALVCYRVIVWIAPAAELGGMQLVEPSLSTVASLMAAVLAALGATGFLSQYVGDVQQFVTYEEAEPFYRRRKAIIASAVAQLRHVLDDPACTRVALVAHSLGTAVAVDALLDLRRFNLARHPANPMKAPLPLQKITHLVTMGSPVDKVNYFFGAVDSDSRVFECLIDGLRGDIGTPPFSLVGRQPQIHWINYWDRADLISGPIETVAPGILRDQEVDNVRVASYAVPVPLAAHAGYFDHDGVISDLFSIVYEDKYSFVRARAEAEARRQAGATNADARPDYAASRRGPGAGSRLQSALFWMVPAVPWMMAATLAELLLGRPPVAQWLLVALVGVLGGAEWAYGRGYGHRGRGSRRGGPAAAPSPANVETAGV